MSLDRGTVYEASDMFFEDELPEVQKTVDIPVFYSYKSKEVEEDNV